MSDAKSMSLAELRETRARLNAEEDAVSFVRRLAQGRLDLVRAEPRLGEDAASLVAPGVGVRMRTTPGGAGPRPVAEQLDRFTRAIARWKQSIS